MVREKLTQVNRESKELYYRAVIENYCVAYILYCIFCEKNCGNNWHFQMLFQG